MDPGLRAKGSLAGHEVVEAERINGKTNIEISSLGFVFEIYLMHKALRNNNQGARDFWHRSRVATLMNVKARKTRFVFFFFCIFLAFVLILYNSVHDQ